jgi:uncharacterized protein YkwD
MGIFVRSLVLSLALAAPSVLAAQQPNPPSQDNPSSQEANGSDALTEAEQLFTLANQARAQAGVGQLNWDPALTAAALQHCQLMARSGPIAHQYAGEPDLETRAAQAGAHFSLVEENVAVGPTPAAIQDEWMHSPGHRANLLGPQVDRLGVAVVEAHGVLYAVEDFSRAVPALSRSQVEIVVSRLVSAGGVTAFSDPAPARAACASNEGSPGSGSEPQPHFIMRWQDSNLTRLPQPLADRLASGKYHQAAVGSCPPQGQQAGFTVYRVAVLLY